MGKSKFGVSQRISFLAFKLVKGRIPHWDHTTTTETADLPFHKTAVSYRNA